MSGMGLREVPGYATALAVTRRMQSLTETVLGSLTESQRLALGTAAAAVALLGAAGYMMSSKPKRPQTHIPVHQQSVEIAPGVYASHLAQSEDTLIKSLYDDVNTLYEAFLRGMKVSNNGPCLGTRGPDGKYQWLSYRQVYDSAHAVGSGLLASGLSPGEDSFIGIYAANSSEWVFVEQAINMFSMVGVPLYDTLGPDACAYIINQTKMTVVFVDKVEKAEKLLAEAKKTPFLKLLFVFENVSPELIQKAKDSNIELSSISKLMELGKNNLKDPVPPHPDSLLTLCYTSGTTGDPKGVMLTHQNIISSLSGTQLHLGIILKPSDRYISYLPLAHMFERISQGMMFMHGCQIGFLGGDVAKLINDMQDLQPTCFCTVPRLLNRITDKIMQGASQGGVIKSTLFNLALSRKKAMLERGIVTQDSIWDKLVFHRMQKLLGGKVQYIVCGAAPLTASVIDFIRCVFGCTVGEGYGQTEATAPTNLNVVGDTSSGNVGPPLPCVLLKLKDVPEMDYYVKDGKGEVCLKGPVVMKGYYKDPEKTKEVFDEEGWLLTGDVGLVLPNGAFRIIDRRKHIFKLAQGEYVAPEKIEGIYTQSPLVAQCFVDGHGLETFLVGVVVPDPEVLPSFAAKLGITGTYEDICKNPVIKQEILKDITTIGKTAGLKGFEQVKDIYIHSEQFTLENGMLTPTFKSKRPALRKRFSSILDDMYKSAKK